MHKYAYVHGDPISGIDPSGLFEVSLNSIQGNLVIAGRLTVLGVRSTLSFLTKYSLRIGSGFTVINAAGDIWKNIRKQFATGMGGLDATAKLTLLRNNVVNTWAGLTLPQKEKVIDELYNIPFGLVRWDITEMLGAKKKVWTRQVVGPVVKETLTFRGMVFPVAEVNYVLWGLINRLAYDDGIKPLLTSKIGSSTVVGTYRLFSGGVWTTYEYGIDPLTTGTIKDRYDTNGGRVLWAAFGWDWAGNGPANVPVTTRLPLATANPTAWGNSLNWSAGNNPRFFKGKV